jgi:hypothetical protein
MGHPQSNTTGMKPAFQIPVSAGFPLVVRLALVACAALAIFILGLVVFAASENHVWPAGDSLRVPL